jgi:mRNA interferase MazF
MYKSGKIVLIPFPFTDLSGMKVRPAVIVSNRPIGDDVVVAFISTNIKKKGMYEVPLKMTKINALKSDSIVVVSKIATLEKKTILGEFGELTPKEIAEVKTKLKNLFL